jgi:hypothetical protein
MSNLKRAGLRLLGVVALAGALTLGGCRTHTQERAPAVSGPTPAVTVDGHVALHSFVALSDAHLQKLADAMRMLATTDAARSADWQRIGAPLAEVARMNVPAVNWFARPDGSYWSVQEGRATANLSDRPYWPRLMAGQTVIGDLVASRATGKSSAIVAVPVRGAEGLIVGVLGSSVYLDSLSLRIEREMQLEPDHLFFSLDAEPLVGLNSNPQIIFLRPLEEGDPELATAMRQILSREEGVVSYRFRGAPRTVLYRKSLVTGWWYGFGVLQP